MPHVAATWAVGTLLGLYAGAATPADRETQPHAAPPADYACDKRTYRGQPLDLSDAEVTFEDDFDRLSVTPPTGTGPWYAPVHGGFGGAKFLPPAPDAGPFLLTDGALTIRMERRGQSWTSGLMQSVDAAGRGFVQKYGYFEIRARFPKGLATWPAFWLKTINQYTDPTSTRSEIDVIEAYGGKDWRGYHAGVHLWPAAKPPVGAAPARHWWTSCYTKVEEDMFDGQFYRYGADVGPQWVVIYFERREVARFPTLPNFEQPLFMLVSLAYLQKEQRVDETPADMTVDYVRVWQRAPWRQPRAP